MRALLDVNVLIALFDGGHAMHRRAMDWMEREAGAGWASCPITQNGVLRAMSQPGHPTPDPRPWWRSAWQWLAPRQNTRFGLRTSTCLLQT
jgi:predicted nucleic acid-binding protein